LAQKKQKQQKTKLFAHRFGFFPLCRFQALEQKFAEEELDLSKTLVQVLDSLDSHKSFISDNIAALHKLYSQTRDNLSVINPNKTPNK
jgi:hypothetical protein